MRTQAISCILSLASVILFISSAFAGPRAEELLDSTVEPTVNSDAAVTMMAELKADLIDSEKMTTNASHTYGRPNEVNLTSLQKIEGLKSQFDKMSGKMGISILERSALNDLSMMLGTIAEKQNFDVNGCKSLRSELKASFDPLSDDAKIKPELQETLDIIGVLCKDAPQGV